MRSLKILVLHTTTVPTEHLNMRTVSPQEASLLLSSKDQTQEEVNTGLFIHEDMVCIYTASWRMKARNRRQVPSSLHCWLRFSSLCMHKVLR